MSAGYLSVQSANRGKKSSPRYEKAVRTVHEKYGDLDGVRAVGLADAGLLGMESSKFVVQVGVAPKQVIEIENQIPDEINGVEVVVIEQESTAAAV